MRRRCATRSPPQGRWRSRGGMRSRWSRTRRPICRSCHLPSAARSSWWPTASWTATAELEVHRPNEVRGERGGEALDLVLHVGVREAGEVLDEALGAAVELLVEAVDDGLVEDPQVRPLAVRAAQEHFPLGRGRLLPLHRVHQGALALGALVEVALRTRDDGLSVGGGPPWVGGHPLDLAAPGG